MLLHRLYYYLKPYLPWGLRMAVRQIVARRRRKACKDIWPIDESAGRTPAGWLGWPDGKRFAFVLTHDVEGPEGLAKCRQLADLEMELGFRSSFNFIPEGPYRVSGELRDALVAQGFEVGVHDLEHDGRLYSSAKGFQRKAHRINQYLQEWKSVGFRSGFMLRNFEWIQQLNISYDTSTFDTDPFEPQPDGARTIFPFWIPQAAIGNTTANLPASPSKRSGYVELPYTLPQDSTLFVLFKEPSIRIWQEKVDWIARHGGMALLNVHPDFISFPSDRSRSSTYPVARYVEFLSWLKEKHDGAYWPALPRQVAELIQPGRQGQAERSELVPDRSHRKDVSSSSRHNSSLP